MLRDSLIAMLILYGVVMAFRQPWTGAVSWAVVSILNPHRLSWRAAEWPVAAAVAAVTMLGLAYAPKRWATMRDGAVLVLWAFLGWMILSTFVSFSFREPNFEYLIRVVKIFGMLFVTLLLLQTRRHIIVFVMALAGSLAFYGTKGGAFTIATGGSYRVWGPDSTFIAGNNELALALIMTIPLLYFLRSIAPRAWMRHALLVSMLLMAAAAIGSHSRGALLALVAMSGLLWLRSKNKFGLTIMIACVALAVLAFMPPEWFERMNTIKTYQEDTSAMGRIHAWIMAWRVALSYPMGGGFEIHAVPVLRMLAPDQSYLQGAHSIYFQVLGENGMFGLFLFLLLWFMMWRQAGWLRREGRRFEDTRWVSELGGMCQVSLVGYLVGGAFLALAYFDLPYDICVVVIVTKFWMKERIAQGAPLALDSLQPVEASPLPETAKGVA